MSGPKRARSRHLPGLVRDAFALALADLKEGRAGTVIELKDLWVQMIKEDPFRAFDTLSKFLPREMLIEVDDARPFAFLATPITREAWLEAHAQPDDESRAITRQ